jgi:hypothetical protein
MKKLLFVVFLANLIGLAGCQTSKMPGAFNPPKRVILFISDAMPVGAPERIPLPTFEALKKQGTYFKAMHVSLAAHPQRIEDVNDPHYYPWGCSLPNPVAMSGTIFIGQPEVKQHLLQHGYEGKKTAFTVNCDSYAEISPGYTIYHQLAKRGFPDLFRDEMPVEDAKAIIEAEDPVFIRVHLQGPGSAGHITFQGAEAYNQSHLKYAEPDSSIPWFQNIWHPKSPYIDQALFADSLLGDFVDWLEKIGRMEETVLMVMGDHGQWDQGTHPPYAEKSNQTPFLIVGKGIKPNQVFEETDVLNLVPTIAFLNQVAKPKFATGRVLTECFVGSQPPVPTDVPLKELNTLLIRHHELLEKHPELLENQELSAVNDQFMTIESVGAWHQKFNDLVSLSQHNREILDKLMAMAANLK